MFANPRKQRIHSVSAMRIQKSNVSSHIYSGSYNNLKYFNYKPLISADMPIEPEPEDECVCKSEKFNRKQPIELLLLPIVSKLPIDYEYISSTYKSVKEMNLPLLGNSMKKLTFPFEITKKKQCFIDLDSTLIYLYYSKCRNDPNDVKLKDFKFVSFRPFLNEFLAKISSLYDVFIFSSGTHNYIEDVMEILDLPSKCIKGYLSKSDCTHHNHLILKTLCMYSNLSVENYVILDDNIANALANYSNSILVPPYLGNRDDQILPILMQFLVNSYNISDIRTAIRAFFNIEKVICSIK